MKNIQYDANQHNINRMVEVERQKINHLKMLNTIYQKKSYSLIKDEKQIDKQRSLRINNQLADKERKWRQTQSQINYENSLLRNKLLQIYIPKDIDAAPVLKANQSLDSIHQENKFGLNFPVHEKTQRSRSKVSTHMSQSPSHSKKAQTQRQIMQTNSKFYTKLSNMQSDLMPRLKLRQHSKETDYFRQMLLKSSPKKSMRMKKIVEKTVLQKPPKFFFPSTKSHRQNTISSSSINPEEPFIFY